MTKCLWQVHILRENPVKQFDSFGSGDTMDNERLLGLGKRQPYGILGTRILSLQHLTRHKLTIVAQDTHEMEPPIYLVFRVRYFAKCLDIVWILFGFGKAPEGLRYSQIAGQRG